MRNYILSTVSLFALVAFAADNGDGSDEMPGATAPRVLPDLTQASALAAALHDEKADAKAKAEKAKAVKAKAKAKVPAIVKAGVEKALRESVEEASDKRRKITKSGPLVKPLHKLLSGGTKHIATLAEKLQCSEKDVRGAIDNLRRIIHPINGVNYLVNKPEGRAKTFGYRKGWKPSADILKRLP